jgi:Transmembrane protein 43
MPSSVTVTKHDSWFSRLIGSIKSVLVGFVFFVLSFPLLFWNEGRAVTTARSLSEGAGAVISVSADAVAPGNEGKLVHVSGAVSTHGPVIDEDLGLEVQAVKLIRTVEMYQWKEDEKSETQKKLGGGTETVTTYSYQKAWSADAIDSSSFQDPNGHENPGRLPFESTTIVADPVRVGAFQLSPEQVEQLTKSEKLMVNQEIAGDLAASDPRSQLRPVDGGYYLGANPRSPAVGDVRLVFTVVNPAVVSVVGVQSGNSFAPYQAAAGGTVLLVAEARQTAAEMFQSAQTANTVMTWILRAVGWFVMFLGLLLIFKPISVVGDVVPLIGSMLGAGVGVFAFLVASVLSLLTVAVSWIAVRPLLGISLLVVAGAAATLLIARGRKHKQAVATAAATTA